MKTAVADPCCEPDQLAAAAGGQAAPTAMRHLERCAVCAEHVRTNRRIRDLVALLSGPPLDDLRLARVKARTLVAFTEPSPAEVAAEVRPVRRWSADALGLAVVAAFTVMIASGDTAAPHAAAGTRVIAVSDASFTQRVQGYRDELRLRDGALVVAVRPERPLGIEVADATLHVWNATFRVSAEGGRLREIEVYRGEVVLARPGRPPAVVRRGRWAEAVAASPASREQRPSAVADVAAPRPRAPRVASSIAPRADRGRAPRRFARGRALLEAGQFVEAAAAFEASSADPGEAYMAEEAAFWSAVAWARGERARTAIAAFRSFLRRYPESLRAGEVRLALGSLLAQSGDVPGARAMLSSAVADPDPTVAAAARRGLAALDGER